MALTLAACGDVPQPFRHVGPNPLLTPGARAGVWVKPVVGAPAPTALAQAVVKSLQDADLVASTRSSAMAAVVEGVASPDGGAVVVDWRMRGADGVEIGRHSQRVEAGLWNAATAPSYRTIAEQAAPRLVAALTPDAAESRQAEVVTVTVRPVSGATGDGAASLAAALKAALGRYGVAAVQEGGAFTVQGSVVVSRAGAASQMDVTWRVLGADGAEIGTTAQGGTVEFSQISGPWGTLARDIAAGGAEGVAQILRSVGAPSQGVRAIGR